MGVLARTARSICRKRVNIGFAHYFGEDRPYLFHQSRTSLDDFRETLKLLSRQFTFCRLSELLEQPDSTALRKPRLALTFDDGFDLFREGVVDVLDDFGAFSTFFVITDCLESRTLMWRNQLMAIQRTKGVRELLAGMARFSRDQGELTEGGRPMDLARTWDYERQHQMAGELWQLCGMEPIDNYLNTHRPYFTVKHLHELQSRNHEIGLHTRSHPFCDRLTPDQTAREFDEPLAWLQKEFGLARVAISYPFGVRLPAEQELRLFQSEKVSCLLGINGFSPVATPRWKLERASFETDYCYSVFANTLSRSVMTRG